MKARATRKMMQQYHEIMKRPTDGVNFMFPHPSSGWTNRRQRHPDDCGLEWAAYHFCKRWRGRSGFNMRKLQRIVLDSGNPKAAYQFARDIKGACMDKLERMVVEAGDPKWMRLFATLSGARRSMLENFAFIAETMSL